jgi:hypothetical protein
MPELHKIAEEIVKIAIQRNNLIWMKNFEKQLYVAFALRKQVIFVAHGDLLTGDDGV